MKVCYTTHLPNLTGASQSLLDLLSGIKNMDVEPVVLLGKHGPLEEELKKRGIRFHIIPYVHDMKSKSRVKNLLKPMINALAVKRIRRFLIKEHVELVHNNSFLSGVGMEAALKAGIPYICHNREIIQEHGLDLYNNAKQLFLLRNAAAAIEISDVVYKKYSRLVPEAHFVVLPDGIEINRYFQERDSIFEREKLELLLAGRIEPGKGQLEAVKAMEILEKQSGHSFRLTIIGGVGDVDYDRKLRQYVREKKTRSVSFLPFADLREIRGKTDIALTCSRAEALGRVTVEGMLAGCLVIGADCGATPELITNGETGLLYCGGDAVALAATIRFAAEHPTEMAQIVQRGQKYAKEHFDLASYASDLYGLYREVLTKKRSIEKEVRTEEGIHTCRKKY